MRVEGSRPKDHGESDVLPMLSSSVTPSKPTRNGAEGKNIRSCKIVYVVRCSLVAAFVSLAMSARPTVAIVTVEEHFGGSQEESRRRRGGRPGGGRGGQAGGGRPRVRGGRSELAVVGTAGTAGQGTRLVCQRDNME